MDNSVVTALAALAGAAIGGIMTVFASWLSQHAQARTQWISQNRALRQDLYREFINQSSKLYVHALQYSNADVVALMGLYAELSRMRIMSSETVVNSADRMLKKIIYSYLEPNKTFPELQQMADSGLIDPLRDFSEACREEFRLRNSPFDR
jgi:ABC-type multidrug transport system fused ATPase/permease subunit